MDTDQIEAAVTLAKAEGKKNGRPSMIILNTIKGKGVSFAEEIGFACHHMPVSPEQLVQAEKEIG